MQMYEKLKAVGIEHCFLIGIGAYNGTADDICYDEIRNAQYSFAERRKEGTFHKEDMVPHDAAE